jgi:hypothetical protein
LPFSPFAALKFLDTDWDVLQRFISTFMARFITGGFPTHKIVRGILLPNRGKISGGHLQSQFNRVVFRRNRVAVRGNRVRVRSNGAANCRNRVGSQTNRVRSGFNGVAIRDNGARFCCLGVDCRFNGVKPQNNGVAQKINGFTLKTVIFANFMVGTTCRSSEAAPQRSPTNNLTIHQSNHPIIQPS